MSYLRFIVIQFANSVSYVLSLIAAVLPTFMIGINFFLTSVRESLNIGRNYTGSGNMS